MVVSRDVVFNEEGFVRKRYLPFQDHFGIGDHSEEDELDLIPHSVGVYPLTNPTLGHGKDDDDSDDDDYPSPPKSIPPLHKMSHPPAAEPEPVMAPPASPPPNCAPQQPPKPHHKLVQRRRIAERAPSPPSPTPSPDSLVDSMEGQERIQARNDELHSWRGRGTMEQLLLDDREPILRLKPTDEDEHVDVEVDMVTVDTHDRIEPPQSFEEAMQTPYAQKWMEA